MALTKSTTKRKAIYKTSARRSSSKKMGIFEKILTAEGWRRLLSRKKSSKKR